MALNKSLTLSGPISRSAGQSRRVLLGRKSRIRLVAHADKCVAIKMTVRLMRQQPRQRQTKLRQTRESEMYGSGGGTPAVAVSGSCLTGATAATAAAPATILMGQKLDRQQKQGRVANI